MGTSVAISEDAFKTYQCIIKFYAMEKIIKIDSESLNLSKVFRWNWLVHLVKVTSWYHTFLGSDWTTVELLLAHVTSVL